MREVDVVGVDLVGVDLMGVDLVGMNLTETCSFSTSHKLSYYI